jgi:PTS system nitrogen regulatory IIA component
MKLSELIGPQSVIVDLRAGDKPHLLGELARQAAQRTSADAQAVLAALTAREALGSTGLGRGFALPHARVPGVDRLFGLFVRLARPLDYEAIDGQPVDLVFLLLIPLKAGNEHVAALAAIAREMRDEGVVQQVRKAGSNSALYQTLSRP